MSNEQNAQKTESLIDWLREFSARFLNCRLYDERKTIAPHVILEFGNHGLFGLQVPRSYGGLELQTTNTLAVIEQLGAIDLTIATLVVNNDFLGVRPFQRFATDAQRDALLAQFATGRRLISYALSEPQAGSNPQSIAGRGRALPGGGFQLTAEKKWIGNAAWASHVNVFVKVPDEGAADAITGFTVPVAAQGVTLGAELATMGMKGMVQSRVLFEDVNVGADQLLGRVGAGMVVANDAMMYTRLAFGAAFLGAMKRCLQIAGRYAERRSGLTTGSHLKTPLTRARLWNGICRVRVLEQLLSYAARSLDAEAATSQDVLVVAKILSAEYLWKTVDDCVQVLGGRGYLETNDLPRFLRDARVARIYEGPTETLVHFLGMRALRGSPMLAELFKQKLDAPVAFERLMEGCAELRERATKTLHLEPPDADNWVAYRAGVICTKLLLRALVTKQSQHTVIDPSILTWLDDEVAAAAQGALAPDLSDQVPPVPAIVEALGAFEMSVGTPQRPIFEEETSMDSLLV